jgi:hypothetical protein
MDEEAPRCRDCGADVLNESYMVTDEVWQRGGLSPDDGRLCVGCLETVWGVGYRPKSFT